MPTTERERRLLAAEDLARKIKLESGIKRKFRKFFVKIARQLRASLAQSGTPIKAESFQREVEEILRKHYENTINKFKHTISRSIKFIWHDVVSKQVNGRLTDLNNEFIERQVPVQSQKIIDTTQKDINESIAIAIALLIDDGKPLSNAEIAFRSSSEFLRKAKPRPDAIAVTETQNPAEAAKGNEMNFLVLLGIASLSLSRKIWTTVGDEWVRPAHVRADGQVKQLGEPFQVDDELLRYPGDTSLGASAGNVIRCRCSSSLSL